MRMKYLVVASGVVLLLVSLCSLIECSCSREVPAGTDCSTAGGECGLLYDKHNAHAPPTQIPFSPANTRTCYRTCFEDSLCKSHVSVVNEQRIRKLSHDLSQYSTQRIFSPRYGKKNYRQSTNCRFTIQCEPGQLLSYSVTGFDLEGKANCSGSPECLDWVKIDFRNMHSTERQCATGELREVHVDGANEMQVEFISNRWGERDGFEYYITCIDPTFDGNAVREGVAGSDQFHRRYADIQQCTSLRGRRSAPSSQSSLLRDLRNALPAPSRDTYIVGMSEFISYANNTITLSRGELGTSIFRGIHLLIVQTRFSSGTFLWSRAPGEFRGYGHLVIYGYYAYFIQTGVDPVFEPTREEVEIIHRLERGLSAALGDEDYYDVNDTLDNPIPPTFLPYLPKGQFEPQRPPGTTLQPTERPSGSPGTPGRLPGLPSGPPGQPGRLPGLPSGPPGAPPRERGARGLQGQGSLGPPGPQPFTDPTAIPNEVDELALQYGNACNGVLRAMACTYQKVVLNRDCN